MEESRYLVLAAEVRAQLQQIERIYGLVDEREPIGGVAGMESLAYQLHNLYGAIEDLLSDTPTRAGSMCAGCASSSMTHGRRADHWPATWRHSWGRSR